MLERLTLWLGAWTAAPARCCVVADLASRQPLGKVRAQPPGRWPWSRWLARPLWHVVEGEDESLLLSLHLPWVFVKPWEICDAEEQLLCVYAHGDLFDSTGVRRAALDWLRPRQEARVVDPGGGELALLQRLADGTALTFGAAVEHDPPAKMALLGVALAVSAEQQWASA